MSVIGFILLSLFLWFMYNLIVKLILPIYKTTRHIKQQFRSMAEQREASHASHAAASDKTEVPKPKVGEYIEFEEVK